MSKNGLEEKINKLRKTLKDLESVAVAYSGGVDSTFLLAMAKEVLGKNVLAITAASPMIPTFEIKEAKILARKLKVKHKLIKTSPLENPSLKFNPRDRCYICKKSLFVKFLNLAEKYGYSYLVDGTNFDDLNSSRPGLKALAELGIKSPLAEAELTKKDIRKYSKIMGLPTWDSPALACLATRVPYGEEITEPKLAQIDQAEEFIRSLGFKQVRVRYHFPIARIELDPEDISNIIESSMRKKVVEKLKSIGFEHIVIDMEGYRSGSMDGR
ncbi:MAG: ATP-dependent sacrificial sulfur transferase LarE [Actinobacteria bacterium]|nr:ATP-dependent sacrificial sulfur transferase LarE [Actinomycetota bacterium]